MAKQVIIDISAAGSIKIDALGFNGQGCEKATEMIEVAIGGEAAKNKKRKPEYYAGSGGSTGIKQTF